MEKYYTVTQESSVYKEYLDYKEMSEKVHIAFLEFAKEHDIETHEYYQLVGCLRICPTDGDVEQFGKYFKKGIPGMFKNNSLLAKTWVNKCQSLGLKSPCKPNLASEFMFFGSANSRLFMVGDILYASFMADSDFKAINGFEEMKASDFFKVIEDYKESLKS